MGQKPEKCEWFNLLIQRVFMEYRAFDVEEKWRQKMTAKFAKATDKPPFLVKL
jgi:hypothetical protein